MKKKVLLLTLTLFTSIGLWAASFQLDKMDPINWWIGMNNPELQIALYGPNIAQYDVSLDYEGVTLKEKVVTDNPNYAFLYLNIDSTAQPGKLKLVFKKDGKKVATRKFELQARKEGSAQRKSFTPADAVYLVMPDRFENGDYKNDNVKGYVQGVNRSNLGQRHGGDIQGVINKIPYVKDLGCTALWMTPFFDNNDTEYSYHHYATGDYYKVDPRLGSNELYKAMADSCHANGLKLIIDVVPNHCGWVHPWYKDKPAKDWFHEWPTYTSSNYRMIAWTDPHASQSDKIRLQNGWFAPNMPDLNLANRELFTYLSQVYIWWIEYAGVDGIRVDTYPYNDIHIASEWVKRFRNEYPNINIVGECWVKTPLEISYYQDGNNNKDGFQSNLPSVMDFILKDHLHAAFNENEGWENGMARFYIHYAQDFAYPDVNNIMNFLDNHDIDRFSGAVNRDVKKYKMGLAMLMTTRGYPQIYAGDEIMLDGIPGNYEGYRFDFPGGWKEDTRNAFTKEGRTAEENEIFDYTRKLLNFRKGAEALHYGKMTQYIPYEGVYIYARYTDNQTVLVIFNNNEKERTVWLDRYEENIKDFTKGVEVTTGKTYNLSEGVKMPGKTCFVLNLTR